MCVCVCVCMYVCVRMCVYLCFKEEITLKLSGFQR